MLADHRGYNVLFTAVESGDVELVKAFLHLKINPDHMVRKVNAQVLAWNGRHSEILVIFAMMNLMCLHVIDLCQLSKDFRIFYNNTRELHAAIKSKN